MTVESERKVYAMHKMEEQSSNLPKSQLRMRASSEECIKRKESSLNGL